MIVLIVVGIAAFSVTSSSSEIIIVGAAASVVNLLSLSLSVTTKILLPSSEGEGGSLKLT